MKKKANIFVAGHNGLVGSSVLRQLKLNGFENLITVDKKRLDLSDDEYGLIMKREPKSWTQYPTYKKRFELLRPLFKILAKANLVPMSFYLKYCFPIGNKNKK